MAAYDAEIEFALTKGFAEQGDYYNYDTFSEPGKTVEHTCDQEVIKSFEGKNTVRRLSEIKNLENFGDLLEIISSPDITLDTNLRAGSPATRFSSYSSFSSLSSNETINYYCNDFFELNSPHVRHQSFLCKPQQETLKPMMKHSKSLNSI